MSGRVAAVSGRATFDLVRERLGPRMGLANLVASMAVTLLTFIAEIGGVALALQLATSVNYLLWIPVVGAAVWLVLWRVKFAVLENAFGLLGLALIVFAVALWKLRPGLGRALAAGVPARRARTDESHWTYCYYAIALFGAAMTPYEVFFFSSGGVEERWTAKDLGVMRANVFIGFPLGGLLSLAIAGAATRGVPAAGHPGRHARAGRPAGGASRWARSASPWCIAGLLRRDVRRRLRDRAVGRLQHRPVLRLAVGQVRRARAGGPVPHRGAALPPSPPSASCSRRSTRSR